MEIQAICCTLGNCNCDSFKPGKLKRRQCEHCKHGWVAHALSKLKVHHMYQSSQVEIVHSNVVFDICSLMLYGTQAIPVRLKILLDRLFSVLKQEEVIQILNALDWTLQDYIRGYVLQDVAGKVLDRWAIMTFEEEIATLQQFLRFGETKSIVELMALQDKEGQAILVPSTRTSSDIRTFIERSAARGPAPPNAGAAPAALTTPKVEKLSTGNVHHFENFINSMAFMLPFQLLGSVSAPLLGSPPGVPRQPLGGAGHGQSEQPAPRRDEAGQGRDHHHHHHHLTLPHPNPPTESSLVGSSSASFASDLDRGGDNPLDGLSAATKTEAEDFPTSDNYSDGPSTPCTPSMSSELTQMSPDSKLRSLDRNGGGGSLKKGRVYCSACEKTFYDKGTLKIHYNAVHLKIKHKCTIEGCNMVFSSLRSRNRHSANPNPRLHMPMNRNNRDKDLRGSLSADEGSEGERRSDYGPASVPASPAADSARRSVPSYVVSHVDGGPKLHGGGGGGSFPGVGHGGILFPNLKTVQPVLPFYRSLVTPAELANTPGTLPSLPLLSSSVPLKPSAALDPEPVPKKKSRKSSMPIKIDKELVEREGGPGEGSSSEDDGPPPGRELRGGGYGRERELYLGGEREREAAKRRLDRGSDREACPEKDGEEEEEEEEEGEEPRHGEASSPYDSKTRDKRRENPPPRKEASASPRPLRPEREEGCERDSDGEEDGGGQRATNGAAFPSAEREKAGPEVGGCRDDYSDPGLAQLDPGDAVPDQDDLLLHHCEICSKTFKNPYSVKMHYRNVHLKEMHMCTVDGCNAGFPSRRSRDRHSANLNLHHKLLTKDSYGPPNQLYPPSSLFRDQDGLGPDYQRQDPRDPAGQTSVIFRGHNRMGLVFPMSKMADMPENSETSPLAEAGGAEEAAVLDLSTTSAAPPPRGAGIGGGGGSGRSSWDSDGGGSEEGEGLEEDPLPMEEDSDESCEGIGLGRRGGEGFGLGGERTPGYVGGGQGGAGGTQGAGGGSPITCHVCQKVYSNKGTFRAHYKTVHLRLLHKCKVPGCDTTFSSVRSRNRHSQNPNLHRNLTVSSALDQE